MFDGKVVTLLNGAGPGEEVFERGEAGIALAFPVYPCEE